jgi:alpha-1,2-mannosyltransferase
VGRSEVIDVVQEPTTQRAGRPQVRLRWVVAAVAGVAFLARLLPVLAGGGLYGLGNYDDGVYYAATAGLLHGRLPYRDFLMLHPPAILLALAPFAALGRILGDDHGLAIARVFWMALGASNAVLTMRFLRPLGPVAALVGGTCYALFFPAVYSEHTVLLEGLSNTLLLLALLLTQRRAPDVPVPTMWLLAAGAVLGLNTSVKIWGVVAVLVFLGWHLVTDGVRRAGLLVAASFAGAAAVCLPFFVSAPEQMCRYVVLDQLGRPASTLPLTTRLVELTGLNLHLLPPAMGWPLVLTLAAVAALSILAWRGGGRLAVLLLLCLGGMLMLTPSWFMHYAGLISVPFAVTVGAGAQRLSTALPRLPGNAGPGLLAGLLVVGLTLFSAPLLQSKINRPFPGKQLAASVANLPGCITTDDPTTLIEMDVLARNLDRGCQLVVDLGGHSYDMPSAGSTQRRQNKRWQAFAVQYLRSGSASINIRFYKDYGFSAATAATVEAWPVLAQVNRYAVRVPQP